MQLFVKVSDLFITGTCTSQEKCIMIIFALKHFQKCILALQKINAPLIGL